MSEYQITSVEDIYLYPTMVAIDDKIASLIRYSTNNKLDSDELIQVRCEINSLKKMRRREYHKLYRRMEKKDTVLYKRGPYNKPLII